MKAIRSTYSLFALLVAGLSMMAWLKMDKMSFYHHYFRGIAEVESRNSQDHIDLLSWESYSETRTTEAFSLFLGLIFCGFIASFIWKSFQALPLEGAFYLKPFQAPVLLLTAPIRAP